MPEDRFEGWSERILGSGEVLSHIKSYKTGPFSDDLYSNSILLS